MHVPHLKWKLPVAMDTGHSNSKHYVAEKHSHYRTPLDVLLSLQDTPGCIMSTTGHPWLYYYHYRTPLAVLLSLQDTPDCITITTGHPCVYYYHYRTPMAVL